MAEGILNALIGGTVDPEIIIQGIENGKFRDESEVFKDLDEGNHLNEFVPCFLGFVKEKLSKNLSKEQISTCSPKRYSTSSRETSRNKSQSRTSLILRFDEQEGKGKGNGNHQKSGEHSNFGKNDGKGKQAKRSNVPRKQMHVDLNCSKTNDNYSGLSLRSNTAFKHDENNGSPLTSTPYARKQTPKRRITPTLITPDKKDFQERQDTRNLFESASVIETSNSSLDSSDSVSGSSVFEHKIKKLEKSMRNRKRNDAKKLPLSAFLASEEKENSKKLSQNVDVVEESLESDKAINSSETSRANLSIKSDISESDDFISIQKISNLEQMTNFINIYISILMGNLISNISVELYFLFSVLNCKFKQGQSDDTDEVLFESVESCIYFAAKVIEGAKSLSSVFDVATLSLITQNKRLQALAPGLVEFVDKKLNNISQNSTSTLQQLSFSSSLGVPFQVEGNNRKQFSSDRYFYSFSKMRDKFYGLLRKWEENHLNHDWNTEKSLGEKFQMFFFDFLEYPTYSQFSQLFVAQLIEMSSQDFSGLLNRDESSSASLLEYLKLNNPSKFQRLQERFFSPLLSQGPCPKPHFSELESFFKLFIDKSCNYQFLVHLRDVLVSRILKINSVDMTSHLADNMTDDNESLMQVRKEYTMRLTESRILAKFLSYIIFSPYESDNQSRNENQELSSNILTAQPFNLENILMAAVKEDTLLVTLPWVVQYLSLMDEASLKTKVNENVFINLIHLYRSKSLRLNEAGLNGLFLLLQLGWMFDQPLISKYISFYKHLRYDLTHNEDNLCKWSTPNGTDLISKSLLIRFCPFISEVKNALSKTWSGSVRKIKPFTHMDKPPMVNTEKLLKENMIQDFFKYKPKYFKETAEFVIERFCNNLKLSASMVLSQEVLKESVESLKKIVVVDDEDLVDFENLKQKNSAFLKQISSVSKSELGKRLESKCDEYCVGNCEAVISRMLPMDVDDRVISVTSKIVSHEVKQRMNEWSTSKMNETYENELNIAFNRFLMGEVKRINKSLKQESSFTY